MDSVVLYRDSSLGESSGARGGASIPASIGTDEEEL